MYACAHVQRPARRSASSAKVHKPAPNAGPTTAAPWHGGLQVRGESAAQDLVSVLSVLEEAPELRDLLARLERDYNKYMGQSSCCAALCCAGASAVGHCPVQPAHRDGLECCSAESEWVTPRVICVDKLPCIRGFRLSSHGPRHMPWMHQIVPSDSACTRCVRLAMLERP